MQRVGGKLHFKIDGVVYLAKGNFTYNVGGFEREVIMGADGIHGYTENPVPGRIQGEITDDGTVDLAKLKSMKNGTVTLELANGKLFVLTDALATGEWTGNSDQGNVPVEFSGEGEEIL